MEEQLQSFLKKTKEEDLEEYCWFIAAIDEKNNIVFENLRHSMHIKVLKFFEQYDKLGRTVVYKGDVGFQLNQDVVDVLKSMFKPENRNCGSEL